MKWFRLYSDLLDDPKVQGLNPGLFKLWINLLCLASLMGAGGELPPLREIAYGVRLRSDRCQRYVSKLAGLGLIDVRNDRMFIHNWSGRQYESDDVTARVKRFRNVSETPPDTDTETESSDAPSSHPPAGGIAAPTSLYELIERFHRAKKANERVGALVDICKAEGCKVDGGRIAGLLKKYPNPQDVLNAFGQAFMHRAVRPEDYAEGVLRNGRRRPNADPLRSRKVIGQEGMGNVRERF